MREAQRRLNPKVWEAVRKRFLSGLMQRSSIPYRIASGLVPCTWFPRRQDYGDREQKGRGDPNAPPDEVTSLYRLPEVERRNKEGSLPVAVH